MKQKASEIYNWLQDAVSDIAQGELYPSNDWTKIENKAEDLFNDKATLRDLLGDQICNTLKGPIQKNKLDALELCLALKEKGHSTVREVMDDIIREYDLERPFSLDKDGFIAFLEEHACLDHYKKDYEESDWNDGISLDEFLKGEPCDFLVNAFFWDDTDRESFWYNLGAKWEGYFED
jgi:hypothetical protein